MNKLQRIIAHILNASQYSVDGIKELVRTEMAVQANILACVLALLWFIIIGAPLWAFAVLFLTWCLMMMAECFNTAIEDLVDKLSPEISSFAKRAKDLGSAGVFFCILIFGLNVLVVTIDTLIVSPQLS